MQIITYLELAIVSGLILAILDAKLRHKASSTLLQLEFSSFEVVW